MSNRDEREELLSYISDAHKDAYGFRPRYAWDSYKAMSLEELHAEAARLDIAVGEAIDAEKAAQEEAAVRFEKKIQNIIDAGAGDRATAIRWDRDSYDDDMVRLDDGYYEYHNGLEYGYIKRTEIV